MQYTGCTMAEGCAPWDIGMPYFRCAGNQLFYLGLIRVVNKLELVEHKKIMFWVNTQVLLHPYIRWCFHPPNGEVRDKRSAIKLASMGVRRGIPDLVFLLRRGEYSGWLWEVKEPGGTLSKEQKEFRGFAESQGFYFGSGHADLAIESLERYLGLAK